MKRLALLVLALVSAVSIARADPAEPKERARELFEQGMSLAAEEKWSPALAAFLRSRELFPTLGNTQNAAVALARLGRYDEAYEMFAALLREFPELGENDRRSVDSELKRLVKNVGSLDIVSTDSGASVAVDGRARGTIPLAAPIRVVAGSHLVRVFKPGTLPFSQRVDVPGGETNRVEVDLRPLTRSGVLNVSETAGARATLLIDGIAVGKTPWRGRVDIGRHSIALRGDGARGTPPVTTRVVEERPTTLSLALEPLECRLRIAPKPLDAAVAIDGVEVGRGVWQGALRCGAHEIEVASEGFLSARRQIALVKNTELGLNVSLDRDPASPRFRLIRPPRFELSGSIGPVIGWTFGGPASSGCDDECSRTLPLGASLVVRAAYTLPSDLGFGIEVGALRARQRFEDAALRVEDGSNGGRLDARVRDIRVLDALLLGAHVGIERGQDWAVWGRLGAGFALASVDVHRSGTLSESGDALEPTRDTKDGRFVYAAPEIGIARRIGSHFEVGGVLRSVILFALDRPAYSSDQTRAAASGIASRYVRYDDALTGRVVPLLVPGVYASYSFF